MDTFDTLFIQAISESAESSSVITTLLQSASIGHLQELMSYYKVENLKNQTPEEFKSKLDEFMELVDAEMEGFRDAERATRVVHSISLGTQPRFRRFFPRRGDGESPPKSSRDFY